MVACDLGAGRITKLSGTSEQIIRWLAENGDKVFSVTNFQGALTFNFHTGDGKSAARVTPHVSGTPIINTPP